MKAHLNALIALTFCLFFFPSAQAESVAPPPSSLLFSELGPVLAEIEAMIKTDTSRVPSFVVREATPDRIEKLFRMPEVVQLPTVVRENGLIFAGLGSQLLSFDTPSDIITKVSTWFPDEVARAAKNGMFFGHLHLWGPYEHWNAEPAAFVSLWNCMPQNAWLKPKQNPFSRHLNDDIPLYPIAAKQSSYEEFDFGFCIHQRSGYQASWTVQDVPKNQQRIEKLAEMVTPVLRRKFETALNNARCRGTGPDDCVLIMRLWASLEPSDPGLAATIERLEVEVASDMPLPELINPEASWSDSKLEDGQTRFDLGLRRAAFLRAKLLSILHAPDAWPGDALETTLQQLSTLRQDFAHPFVRRWYMYEIDYRNDPINPWLIFDLTLAQKEDVQLAMLNELERLALSHNAGCEVFNQWFKHGGKSLQTRHVLWRLRSTNSNVAKCGTPDFEWLRQQTDTENRHVLYGYLALMDYLPVSEKNMLAVGLTNSATLCTGKSQAALPNWLRLICMKGRSGKFVLRERSD